MKIDTVKRAKILKQETRGEKMAALRGCTLKVQFW
jgi:hypothetical protein